MHSRGFCHHPRHALGRCVTRVTIIITIISLALSKSMHYVQEKTITIVIVMQVKICGVRRLKDRYSERIYKEVYLYIVRSTSATSRYNIIKRRVLQRSMFRRLYIAISLDSIINKYTISFYILEKQLLLLVLLITYYLVLLLV